jgi:hypothetical protein
MISDMKKQWIRKNATFCMSYWWTLFGQLCQLSFDLLSVIRCRIDHCTRINSDICGVPDVACQNMPNGRKITIYRIANFLVFRVLRGESKRECGENHSIDSPFCSLSNEIRTIFLGSMVTELWIENWNRPKIHIFRQRLYLWGPGFRQETLWNRDLRDF